MSWKRTKSCWSESEGFAVMPTSNVGPSNHVFARSMTPADVAPVDVLRMPLVEQVICISGRIIHKLQLLVLALLKG